MILASGVPPGRDKSALLSDLWERVSKGATVVFLTPDTLLDHPLRDNTPEPLRWLRFPPDVRCQLAHTPNWYFRADHWAKEHAVFTGLPAGGILDYVFYRDVISSTVLRGLPSRVEAISGAIQTSGGRKTIPQTCSLQSAESELEV